MPTAPGGAPLADFGTRLGAYLLDLLVLAPALVVLEIVAFVPAFLVVVGASDPALVDPVLVLGVFGVGALLLVGGLIGIYYLYFVTYQLRTGQTVGKRVTKIKVVGAVDGSPMTRPQAIRRWLVMHASSPFAPYFLYVDGSWQLWDKPYRQCLHDKCAETVVVKVAA